jgi:hypothetical protein
MRNLSQKDVWKVPQIEKPKSSLLSSQGARGKGRRRLNKRENKI